MNAQELFNVIFVEFAVFTFLGIIGAIGSSILLYFRSVKQCQKDTANEVAQLKQEVRLIKKGIILHMRLIQAQTKHLHGSDADDEEIEIIVREMMNTED